MKSTEKNVEKFYSELRFPGIYSADDLQALQRPTGNYYLDIIENYVCKANTIMDAGCGTGLVTNLMAMRWPSKQFIGLDFSQSLETAKSFAAQNSLNNVQFQHQDLVRLWHGQPQDLVICQGVLHHIPRYHLALHNLLHHMSPHGSMLLGLYHPWGKQVQRWLQLVYENQMLCKDQTENPFESTFDLGQLRGMVQGYNVKVVGPTIFGSAALASMAKARSGAIVMYEVSRA